MTNEQLNRRCYALTAAVASILKHLPAARAELQSFADQLVDAPPIALSDEDLELFAQEIRHVIAGTWM